MTSQNPAVPSVANAVRPKDNNRLWADTAPVLHFRHGIDQKDSAAPFAIHPLSGHPAWFGGQRLKYGYRLDRLTLTGPHDGAPVRDIGPLHAVWMSTPYRQDDASGTGNPVPSEHEGPDLKLLDGKPWTSALDPDDGAAATDGNPAEDAGIFGDRFARPRRSCVFGADATAHSL